jgi:hypothetical protein
MFVNSDFQPQNTKYFIIHLNVEQKPSSVKMTLHYMDKMGSSEGTGMKVMFVLKNCT